MKTTLHIALILLFAASCAQTAEERPYPLLETVESKVPWQSWVCLLPLDYDDPSTPEVEELSVWQTPAYKLTENGRDRWFRDHFIERREDFRIKSAPFGYWNAGDIAASSETILQSVAERLGLKPETDYWAYVDEFIAYRGGAIFRVRLAPAHGGGVQYRVLHMGLLLPTRVPASAPVPVEPVIDFPFAGAPELDPEDPDELREAVDVGTRFDEKETADVERFRIWRGPGVPWVYGFNPPEVEARFQYGHLAQEWFLVSGEALAESAEVDIRGGEAPGLLSLDKVAKISLDEYRESEKKRLSAAEISTSNGIASIRMTWRLYHGRRVAMWHVSIRDGNASLAHRFFLMNGQLVTPIQVNVSNLIQERLDKDPAAYEALGKERLDKQVRYLEAKRKRENTAPSPGDDQK